MENNKEVLQEIIKILDVELKDLESKVFSDEKISAQDKAFFSGKYIAILQGKIFFLEEIIKDYETNKK